MEYDGHIFHVQYDHSSFQQLKIYGFFSDDLNEVSNKRTWDSRIRLAKKSWDDSRIRLAKKWDSRIRLGKSIMILISSNIQITFFFSIQQKSMAWIGTKGFVLLKNHGTIAEFVWQRRAGTIAASDWLRNSIAGLGWPKKIM